MLNRRWFSERFAEWTVTGIFGLIGGAVLTFLRLNHSVWASPLLYGFAAACMIWACGALFIGVSRLPRLRTKVTLGNIEDNIRRWLDRSGCSVKTDSIPEAFFRLVAQLPGGTAVLIGRPRTGLIHQVLIRASVINEQSIPKELQDATKEEQERLLELIRLELGRAKVGYFGLAFPVNQQFSIGKDIGITDHLSEEEFMRAVWDVEAAVHVVTSVYRLWLKRIPKQ